MFFVQEVKAKERRVILCTRGRRIGTGVRKAIPGRRLRRSNGGSWRERNKEPERR